MSQTHVGLSKILEKAAETHQNEMTKVLEHSLSMSLRLSPEDALCELGRSEIVCLMAITSLGLIDVAMSNTLLRAVEEWKLFPRVASYFGRKLMEEYAIPRSFLKKAYKFAKYGNRLGFLQVPQELLGFIKVLIREAKDIQATSSATGPSVQEDNSICLLAHDENAIGPHRLEVAYDASELSLPLGDLPGSESVPMLLVRSTPIHLAKSSHTQPVKPYSTHTGKHHSKRSAKKTLAAKPNPLNPRPSKNHSPPQVFVDRERATRELWDAVKSGDCRAVEIAIETGADLSARDPFGDTLLHLAARDDKEDIVRSLISHGAEINGKGLWGYTPLHYAARSRTVGCLTTLLAAGADFKARDGHGDTPLHEAAREGCNDAVMSLLAQGAEAEMEGQCGRTPLHCAALSGSLTCVSSLLDAGAKINARDNYLWTPLHRAASMGHFLCIRLLVVRGADINVTTIDGYTTLHEAAERGHLQCIKFLVDKGAHFSSRDLNGLTPLHLAAENGHLPCTMFLAEKDSLICYAQDSLGRTPLAIAKNHPDVQKYLRTFSQ